MKICALVDPMGTYNQTPEEEYEEIKERFCEELGLSSEEVRLVPDIMPYKLEGMSTDVYVIDWGGMLPGSEDLTRDLFRQFIHQVEEKPNTLFVIWSKFSFDWYQELIEEENPELVAPNVVFALTDDGWDRISKWFEK